MKKFFMLFWVLVCAMCLLSVKTTHAQPNSASIEGETNVLAGMSYTYNVTVAATGISVTSVVKCEGTFSGEAKAKTTHRGDNGSLINDIVIEVKVKNDAQPGDTGTITVTSSVNSMNEDGTQPEPVEFTKKLTAVVVTPQTPAPAPTLAPTPTPAPTLAPTPTPSASSAPRREQTLAPAPSVLPGEQTLADDQPLREQIDTLEKGEVATFTATSSPYISFDALSALKQKQSILTLEFATYTCTVTGASLGTLPDDMAPLDLSMSMIKDVSLSESAGGRDIYQLHFAHCGALPGVFGIGFPAAAHQPGDTLYLYYFYDTSGVIEYKHSAVVDERGWVTFDIYHCSSYFVTDMPLDDMTMAPQKRINEEVTPDEAYDEAPKSVVPQTSPAITLPVLIGALLIAVGLSIFVTLQISNRRRK